MYFLLLWAICSLQFCSAYTTPPLPQINTPSPWLTAAFSASLRRIFSTCFHNQLNLLRWQVAAALISNIYMTPFDYIDVFYIAPAEVPLSLTLYIFLVCEFYIDGMNLMNLLLHFIRLYLYFIQKKNEIWSHWISDINRMALEDFCQLYSDLDICSLCPSFLDGEAPCNWKTSSYEGRWVAGVTAGGCMNNNGTWRRSGQITLHIIIKNNKVAWGVQFNFYTLRETQNDECGWPVLCYLEDSALNL